MLQIRHSVVVGVIAFIGLAVTEFTGPIPRLFPSGEEQIYRTGASFRLTCEATKPVEWKQPILSHHLEISHNDEAIITEETIPSPVDGYAHRSILEVNAATILDTGYYICHYAGNDDIENPNVAVKTYVYVEDESRLIVSVGDEGIVTVVAHQSSREVIPCKPTSPKVELTLLDPSGLEINPLTDPELWSYDPHEGFIANDVAVDMSGMYTCNAVRHEDNSHETITYVVSVQPATAGAPKPHINDAFASKIALRDSFQLNCSASYDPGVTIDLKWIVPHPEGIDGRRIRTGKLSVNKGWVGGMEQQIAHQVLDVTNATEEDEGYYKCKTIDHTQKFELTSVFIKIHGEDVSYVNISDIGLQSYLEQPANETIKWVVFYEAYPKPQIIWSKGSRENIIRNTTSKYVIKDELRRTVLEIKEIGLADSGQYLLTVHTNKVHDTRSFTLRVTDKPIVKAHSDSHSKAIHFNERFNLGCQIIAYPESDVKLFFRECLPQNPCTTTWSQLSLNQTYGPDKTSGNEEKIKLTRVDFQTKKVMVSGNARVAGQYRCEACNTLGCTGSPQDKSSIVQIFVSDLSTDNVNGTELIKSHQHNPVAGEGFNLTCGVLLDKFRREISWWWRDSNGQTFRITSNNKPPGAVLSNNLKRYSYAEVLEWPQISKDASGTYICQTTYLDNKSFNTSLIIEVLSGRAPVIHNASNSDVSIEQFTELSLFCNADGLPTPKAEWIKDGTVITEGVAYTAAGWSLYVRYANLSHAGWYTCRFSNINGTEERTMFVNIREKPVHAGIIVAIVIVVAIVLVLIIILAKKIHQDKKRKEFFRANQLDIFDKGNPESINPDLPIDEQTELLPYDKRWEFPRDRLKLGKQLGAGAFGRVVKAEAEGIDTCESTTTVAVKMVRSHGNMIGLKALMSELKIMIHMGSHLNVVNVLGACTKNVTKGELLVIVEYCRYGNIQNYLIRNRAKFLNQVDSRGYVITSTGEDQLTEAEAQRGYPAPRSPLGSQSTSKNYSGSENTDVTFLSMSPTAGGARQSDLVEGIDSNGHTILTSAPSNASGNQPYPPWRSNYRGDYRDLPEQPLCTRDLLCWAFQIARGMDYLARRKILHGDLAARNVLLADNNIVKIADFGLAREVYRSGNYKKKGEGPLPVKWMAIESIVDRVFSTQSDVWSFGIVLWELFSLGKTPYPGMEADEQFFIKLRQGYRMEKPKYAPNMIYQIMKNCWLHDPTERPDFTALSEALGEQLNPTVRRHYLDLNEAYIESNNAKESTDYLSMMNPVNYVNVGSGPSPMPGRQYANVPSANALDENNDQTSHYLAMGSVGSPNDNLPGDGYLFMTNADSRSPISRDSGIRMDSNDSEIKFSTRLRMANEELPNSLEMHPMLGPVSPNQVETEPKVNGFSNPNYQNPPVIKCSDLDDVPLATKQTNSPMLGKQLYVNVNQSPASEDEEQHYVSPRNNVRIV
ncbi:vascular endothelial growth factor receptor 1-like isoform X1 [Daphnia carinata]|uniref:vascular endothelial growth factor receptor 1-like isoform X1 n=1 Tax=Daphnia carinata TaxID=120202 RepID=UPI00257B0FCB|nr:vascular endothelial growth factor receptor 1-like isoform X1 [Daphnia carinata]XP_057365388.1 vascular endothelial growth factor receptor 1-like isoform X1 [Daphnia carinata]XP_057365389.1 vascular endothelial growth factor receptor 1-like isoform X1 [Daphnia carinata]